MSLHYRICCGGMGS